MNFDSDIKDGWMINSSQSPFGDPNPSPVLLSTSDVADFESDLTESVLPIVAFKSLFDRDVWKFKEKAKFLITLDTHYESTVVKGTITYMVCNGRQCLSSTDVPFLVLLN